MSVVRSDEATAEMKEMASTAAANPDEIGLEEDDDDDDDDNKIEGELTK